MNPKPIALPHLERVETVIARIIRASIINKSRAKGNSNRHQPEADYHESKTYSTALPK